MEWTVVTALGTLIGLFVSVGVPIINNTKKMTQLIISVDMLTKEIQDHGEKLKEHNVKIHENEVDIAVLKEKVMA